MFEGKTMAGKKINFISKYLKKEMDSEADIQRRNASKVIVSIECIKKKEINVEKHQKELLFLI